MKKETEVTLHPNLIKAMKAFIPEFGNNDDRIIAMDLAKVHKKISTIDCKQFRFWEKERQLTKLTAKMKDIQREEQSLIRRITSRNLDF